MPSSQHSAAPPAGSTSVFQSAARWRPDRQRTSQHQATVATMANATPSHEIGGTCPSVSRATLDAIFGGQPLCMANQ